MSLVLPEFFVVDTLFLITTPDGVFLCQRPKGEEGFDFSEKAQPLRQFGFEYPFSYIRALASKPTASQRADGVAEAFEPWENCNTTLSRLVQELAPEGEKDPPKMP